MSQTRSFLKSSAAPHAQGNAGTNFALKTAATSDSGAHVVLKAGVTKMAALSTLSIVDAQVHGRC